jgi:hypothetical protein
VAILIGTAAALHYQRANLTLSHYDARGHLIVARRIADSITPGWQQIGAVWLPLPHLLNAVPVQFDPLYRTGGSAVAISILSFAAAAAALAWIVQRLSGSTAAAVSAAAVFTLNPNVLYLQATPMTEPLLIGLVTLGVALLIEWVKEARPPGGVVGIVLALACLTRYEAWPITMTALAFGAWALVRGGSDWFTAARRIASVGIYPLLAVLSFFVFSRIVIGEWFVGDGFFVPDNAALGRPHAAAAQILWGIWTLGGLTLAAVAGCGAIAMVVRAARDRERAGMLLPLALFSSAALPWVAFLDGHPYRIRYMVPLIAAEAVAAGALVGIVSRAAQASSWRPAFRLRSPQNAMRASARRAGALAKAVAGPVLAAVLIGLVAYERPPLDTQAAMVVEAQWDRPNVSGRQPVTDVLRSAYDGEAIMVSMGSLGHYMQDLSQFGFELKDFLHEGNGDIWLRALKGPRPFVGWILIEEQAEGGDMLAKIARENPAFLDGFSRASEGAGVALYVRQNRTLNVAR